jgi:hypothetical protein
MHGPPRTPHRKLSHGQASILSSPFFYQDSCENQPKIILEPDILYVDMDMDLDMDTYMDRDMDTGHGQGHGHRSWTGTWTQGMDMNTGQSDSRQSKSGCYF